MNSQELGSGESRDFPFKGRTSLKGYVLDSKTKEFLPYASVTLHRKRDKKLVKGILTDDKGYFIIKEIPPGVYFLKADFVGFKAKIISLIKIGFKDTVIDIGKIYLKPAIHETEPVEVTSEPLPIKFEIDRKVINVSEQPAYQSGTAIDILRNVPSVNVDIKGNVSLRGSESFQVYIDGRPSILEPNEALQQIPTTSIDKIEIITNPSAKYDPEGVTGIINVILKKRGLQGLRALTNLNIGTYNNYGGDFLFTVRKEKFNVFFGLFYNKRNFPGSLDLKRNIFGTEISSKGDYERGFSPKGIRTGFDFKLNQRNSFGLSFNFGEWEMKGSAGLEYTEFGDSNSVYITENLFERKSPYFEIGFYENYRLGKEHELNFDFTYSKRTGDESSITYKKNLSGNILSGNKTTEKGPSMRLNTRLNYSLPVDKFLKFESGFEGNFSRSEDITDFYEYDTLNADFVKNDFYHHEVLYKKDIYAFYTLFKGNMQKLGYQLGLRAELMDRKIWYRDTNFEYLLRRWDYFPTLHFSYEFKKGMEFIASYTRRIRRPRAWWLEPFITWMDAYNVRKGNPDLKPIYIDNYETGFQFPFSKGSLMIEGFYRVKYNEIERLRIPYNNSVFMMIPYNVGTSYSLGSEIIFDFRPLKFFSINFITDLYNYRLKGKINSKDYVKENFNYNFRLNLYTFIIRSIRIQLSGRYRGPRETSQGKREEYYTFDLGIQKFFMKRRLVLNLQIRDIFRTGTHSYIGSGSGFTYTQNFIPQTPLFMLTITYNYNNFKMGKRKKGEGMEIPEREFEF